MHRNICTALFIKMRLLHFLFLVCMQIYFRAEVNLVAVSVQILHG